MSMRGRLIADFESFYTAVDKAEVKLRSFDGGAATVTKRLNTLADSFSGRKVIQEATLAAEAIREIGGVSKLSTDEAARGLRTLEAGMDKMLRTGQEIPTSMMKTAAELRKVRDVSEDADKTVSRLSSTYRQFDGILQSLGINIGPYVKGLEDLTALAQQGARGFGLLWGAVAVFATALAAIKFGQHVGEVTGLTEAIARGTAVLKGFGDVQQEEMLARMQSIELAGHAEKMWAQQAKSVEEATKAAEEHSQALRDEFEIGENNRSQMERLAKQLEEKKTKRLDDARATFAASQAQSEFAEQAHFTTEVIAEQTDHLAEHARASEEAKRKVAEFMNAETLNQRVNESSSFTVSPLTATQLSQTNAQYDPFGKGGNFGALARLSQLEALEGTYAPKSREQYLRMLSDMRELAALRLTLGETPGYAGGVTNAPGGFAVVGEAGPEIVRLPSGSDVIPNHKISKAAGGVVINGLTIQANTRADGENAGRAFVNYLRSIGQLLPASS